jgi:uncharacterized protein involved in exopolysaccharide biosynthesis
MINKEMGILDIILVVAKHRLMVIIICCLAAIAAISYSLLTPMYWKSTATIMPVTDSEGLGSFSTNLLDMVGGGFMKTGKSELAVDFVSIMKSRRFREDVVKEFNLISYYKIKKQNPIEAMELAILELVTSTVKLTFDQETNLVIITAETKDKELSRKIAQYYVDSLAKYNQSNRMSKGRQKREFLEHQVTTHMHDADSLGLALRNFQVKNRSIALDQQTEALVKLYSDNAAQYMQAEMEYELAQTQYTANSPVLKALGEKLALMKSKLRGLENSGSNLTPEYIIQIDKIPDLARQYAQLMINVEIKKKIIEYIYPQFELAKLEELKDLPTFEVYDSPQTPGLRSKPKRALIVVITVMAAFILACILALIKESLVGDNSGKIKEIVAALKGKG